MLTHVGARDALAWTLRTFQEITMLDINGFLTSVEFLAQLAAFVSTILGALVASLIGGLIGGGGV